MGETLFVRCGQSVRINRKIVMNKRTKVGLDVLKVAAIIGILGDVLLRQTPWGLNVFVFNLAFVAGMLVLFRRHAPERLTAETYGLIAALVFFASMFVWRDAIELRIADTLAIIVILGVLFLPTLKISAKVAGVFQYAVGVVWAAVNLLFAPLALLASDIGWSELPMTGWRKHIFAVVRSLLIALPLILIFGALFMAADAVYDGWVRQLIDIDLENALSHGALFAVFAWLTAGYLRGSVFPDIDSKGAVVQASVDTAVERAGESKVDQFRAESGEYPVALPDNKTVVEHINIPDEPKANADIRDAENMQVSKERKRTWSWANIDNSILPGFTLGTIEVGIVLGLLNLLFLSFVIFQVPYLFGGMELVQSTPDFKLADYARRGFGELVVVSALLLPILLASHWLIKKENPVTEKLFRILAAVQIVLLFVIMASAVQRLVLLTGDLGYGLTTVRLYPMIFMAWLAIVFVWFGATVLRGARRRFAWGALWSAFLILGATHVLDPDAFIVRTNIALMQQGREFDTYYNFSLSADALPEALTALQYLGVDDRCRANIQLRSLYRELGQASDLRSLNISRRVGLQALDQNEAEIHQVEGCANLVPDNPPPYDLSAE